MNIRFKMKNINLVKINKIIIIIIIIYLIKFYN